MDSSRQLVLVVNWRPTSPRANIALLEKSKVIDLDLTNKETFSRKNSSKIDLNDCINYFSQEETLSGDDKWYCGKCKTHVVANKKMEVFRAPEYLIIHLKRFSHRGGVFGSRKINEAIDFPLDGFDLSRYVISSQGAKL